MATRSSVDGTTTTSSLKSCASSEPRTSGHSARSTSTRPRSSFDRSSGIRSSRTSRSSLGLRPRRLPSWSSSSSSTPSSGAQPTTPSRTLTSSLRRRPFRKTRPHRRRLLRLRLCVLFRCRFFASFDSLTSVSLTLCSTIRGVVSSRSNSRLSTRPSTNNKLYVCSSSSIRDPRC